MADVEERALEQACLDGEVLDCADGGARRRIDAAIIRRLCVQRSADVDPRGIRISNASVVGALDLAGVDVAFPLRFEACDFDRAPILHGAHVQDLAFVDSDLPGLLANGLRVQRDVDLSRSTVTGGHRTTTSTSKASAIWLCESEIGGRLLFVGTKIRPDGERAIQADRMRVGGTIRFLQDFQAYGEVRLIGIDVAGSLDMSGLRIASSTDWALDLGDAIIGGAVFLVDDAAGRRPDIRGRIDMRHARISGHMYVRNATVVRPPTDPVGGGYEQPHREGTVFSGLRLSVAAGITIAGDSRFEGAIDLSAADLNGLSIGPGCAVVSPGRTALDLTNAELRSSLRLADGVTMQGTLRLVGSHIRGVMDLTRLTLSDPEGQSIIKADGVTVDGDVEMERMSATGGQLKFWRATLQGGLDATAARLVNPDGCTLRLHSATVRGSVRLVDGFSSSGCVMLNRSTIGGSLDCTGGSFQCDGPGASNRGGHAIQAVATIVGGSMDLGWSAVDSSVDLTDATTTVLEDDPSAWPERYFIAGFTYQRLDVPGDTMPTDIWDWRRRRAWLRRQTTYDAGPYEQAAKVYRQHGYAYGAEQILIAQRTDARRARTGHRTRLRSGLDAIYGWSVGYGYRPGRVLWPLALFLILVSATLFLPAAQQTMRATDARGDIYTPTGIVATDPVHGAGGDACGNGAVRCFHPILYAIDTVVPLISLDQRATWYPDAHTMWGTAMEWWLNIAAVVGWLLSSVFLLSFARMARSA